MPPDPDKSPPVLSYRTLPVPTWDWRRIRKAFLWAVIGAVWYATFSMWVAVQLLKPVHQETFDAAAEDLYRYWVKNGAMPSTADQFMSSETAADVQKTGGLVHYDGVRRVLEYQYEQRYPLNISMWSLLTFGLYVPPGPEVFIVSLDESNVRNNASLRIRLLELERPDHSEAP